MMPRHIKFRKEEVGAREIDFLKLPRPVPSGKYQTLHWVEDP